MNNEQIIWSNRVALMKQGIIGHGEKMVVVEDAEGKKSYIAEPEQIHTYSDWKRRGFTVKHGEKAVASFNIWKSGKAEGEEEAKMFMKKASFFKESQVEPTVVEQKGA